MRLDLPKDDYTELLRNAISASCPELVETNRTEPDLTALSFATARSGRSAWVSTYEHKTHGILVDLEESLKDADGSQTVRQVVAETFDETICILKKWFGEDVADD